MDDQLDTSGPAPELTNGAETFEALQWAAWAAVQTLRALTATTAADWGPLGGAEPSVLSRIYANCRQLKEAALRLEQENHGVVTDPDQPAGAAKIVGLFRAKTTATVVAGCKVRLNSLVAGEQIDPAAVTKPRLFGATVEETARALFTHPRPTFDADPDIVDADPQSLGPRRRARWPGDRAAGGWRHDRDHCRIGRAAEGVPDRLAQARREGRRIAVAVVLGRCSATGR